MRGPVAYALLLAGAAFFAAGAPRAVAASSRGESAVRGASERLARGDTLGAIHWLERSGLGDHGDARAAVLLGRLLREQGTIHARLRSQRVLESARARFPGSAEVHMELGRTYLAQRFFPAAVSCFRHVLELDPARCEARYLIGAYHFHKWRRMNTYTDDLAAARRALEAALACDGSNAEAAAMVLIAGYALGDTSSTRADELAARFPDRAEIHLSRGVIAYERGDWPACEAHFARGLGLMAEEERAGYGDLGRVLAAGDGDRYQRAGPAMKASLTRGYWVAADPDPTTPLNERLLEHVYRVFLADALFSNEWTGRRGYRTDRGEAFVKFGPPLAIDHSLGDEYDTGRVETWSYVIAGVFHQVLFVDEFLNGDPRIPREADFELNFIRNTPGETALAPRTAPVGSAIDVTAFRDHDLAGSLYVAMRVDADSLGDRVDLEKASRFVARGAYFDTEWNREGGFADTIRTDDLPVRGEPDARHLAFVRRIDIPFGRYHLACALEDERARARAIARADADAARFSGDGLAVSDLLLFDEANHGDRLGVVERGGLRMIPRVGHRYRPGDKVNAYAEVYNLAAPGGLASYDLSFSIYPASGTESVWELWRGWIGGLFGLEDAAPVISQGFRREAREHAARERMTIDIGALEPGRYELVVEVVDRASGVSAVSHTALVKERPREP